MPRLSSVAASSGQCGWRSGDLSTAVDAGAPTQDPAEHWGGADGVDQPAEPQRRDEATPARQPTQCVVVAGAEPPLVRLVGHAGFVGGHVDPGGAIPRAALAAEAQVKRGVHLGGAPAARDQRAVDHLLQHPRAAARRVLLVAGGLVAGAHHATARGVVGDALADAAALVDGPDELGVGRLERGSADGDHAEVAIDGCRVDEDTGVQQVLRVEQLLDLPEQPDGLGRVHARQQLGAGAAVAVLAGH